FGEAVVQALGDVVEAGLSSPQQGVEVLQGAGMAPHVAVGTAALLLGEGLEAREAPDELGGLGGGERTEVEALQAALLVVGEGEGEPAGEHEPAGAGAGDPAGEELSELGVPDGPGRLRHLDEV